MLGAFAGVGREINALKNRRPSAHGNSERKAWSQHIDGALAEMAVAKLLDRYWCNPIVDRSLRELSDVSTDVQVRSTANPVGSLILHPHDLDDARFYLVITSPTPSPRFLIVGWIAARDGKQQRFWRTDRPNPAYFIPQEVLHDADSDH